MSVRDKILEDIHKIESQNKLNEIYDFIQQLNTGAENRAAVMELRGCLSDGDAQELTTIVNNEFTDIEGDWE